METQCQTFLWCTICLEKPATVMDSNGVYNIAGFFFVVVFKKCSRLTEKTKVTKLSYMPNIPNFSFKETMLSSYKLRGNQE